jgi:hypothetical protein
MMPSSSWFISTVLIFLFGAFGAFFTAKVFLDPEFSDWISPGPGQPLVGDAGRMLMFEKGPDGIQTKLLGVTANALEGILLGLGSIGMILSPFQSNLAQFLTCALLPLEACYYLVNIIYFPLTGASELAIPGFVMGGGLMAVCFWRLQNYLYPTAPNSAALVLKLYMAYFALMFVVGINMFLRAPQYEEDMQMFIRVRDHFLEKNGMTWTKGLAFPDGFEP